MVNIVFLDIDGVLNHQRGGKTEQEKFGLSLELVANLKTVVESVDNCKIVISSAWRHFEVESRVDQTRPWRECLEEQLDHRGIIIGDIPTATNEDCSRGREIKMWIEQNQNLGIGGFVILDDEVGDIIHQFPNNTVDCEITTWAGLTENKAKEAIWILTNFGKDKRMTDNTWFTSDTHFFHANIVKYCNRPWNSGKDANGDIVVTDCDVAMMNHELIERWNGVVGKDDVVWHLGDFCLGKKENYDVLFPVTKRDEQGNPIARKCVLNGRINLLLGNHDHHKIKFYYDLGFNRVYDRSIIINNFFILSHAPVAWVQNGGPFVNIFGHVHDSEVYNTWGENSVCVCVERHNYTPVSWKTIKDKLAEMNNGDNTEIEMIAIPSTRD